MTLDLMSNSSFFFTRKCKVTGRRLYQFIKSHLGLFSRHSFNLGWLGCISNLADSCGLQKQLHSELNSLFVLNEEIN